MSELLLKLQLADSGAVESNFQQIFQLHFEQAAPAGVVSPSSHYLNNSCGSWFPLTSPTENTLSPCFVSLVFGVFAVLIAVLAMYQLVQSLIFKKNLGSCLSLHSTNYLHYLRINAVILQGVLYVDLIADLLRNSLPLNDIRVLGFLLTAVLIFCLLLPLHIFEIRSRIVPSATLLLFWPLNFILNMVIVIQQSFSNVRIIETSYLDWLLALNAMSIFLMEYLHWAPTKQLVDYYKLHDLPMDHPDLISAATFSYMNPLIVQGMTSNSITENDMIDPMDVDDTATAGAKMLRHWNRQTQRKRPSLGLAVLLTVLVSALCTLLFEFLDVIMSFLQPQMLRLLIRYFNSDADTPLIVGFSIAASMFFISIFRTYLMNQYFVLNFETFMRARSGLMSLIYQKALKLSVEARAEKSTGEIVTLMSVDVGRVQDMSTYAQQLFSAPLQFILCLLSLHALVGNALWGGILVMILMVPLNTFLAKSMRRLHKQQMVYKDKRSRLVTEILTSIKSIKLYTWESSMLERLRNVRNNEELKNMRVIGCFSAFMSFLWNLVPFLVSCATFSLFAIFSKKPLTPDLIFPALSLFNLLNEPIAVIPAMMTGLIEVNIALGRIRSFLLADELDDSHIEKLDRVFHKGDVALEVDNLTFFWGRPDKSDTTNDPERDVASPKIALKNISLTLKKGEMACIVGRVGSGKSTLMKSILGELPCEPTDPGTPTTFRIHGDVAYCSQVPWIMNASVKENILFGKRYEDDFYQKTIKACQLLDDLDILPDGDETLVGEKGISLSGGQKARISLARAVYKRADIYLLDDILSAVDAHVSKHITDEVLGKNGLLSSKTIILATNSVSVLSHSNNITLLDHGEILERGSFKEVFNAKGALYELIAEFGKSDQNAESVEVVEEVTVGSSDETITDDEEKDLQDAKLYTVGESSQLFDSSVMAPLERTVSHLTLRRPSDATFKRVALNFDKGPKRTAQDVEKVEKGKVTWAVYFAYAKACSLSGVAVYLFFIVVSSSLSVAGNYWLKTWADANKKTGSNENVGMFIGVYAIFGIGAGLCVLVQTVIMWIFCSIRASLKLHDGMAKSIMRAPMSYFETTPVGRILNRFSNDINKIDEWLPRTFSMFFRNSVSTCFTIGVIAVSMPKFLFIMATLSLLYVYFQRFYMATSRQLKRIRSVTVSPIYAHLQETLNGLDTVRAYDEQERFIFLSGAHIDFNMKAVYAIRSVNRWLTTRLQFIGSLIIFSSSSLAILTRLGDHPMSAGMVGLVMSYALQITSSLNMIVRMTVEVESSVVCVERVLEYSQLKPELPAIVDNNRPPAYWPLNGSIKFDHYSTKYRAKLDPVLNDVCLEIKPEEKIGIVGRTGAGKSTLASALYRLIEPTEGNISIDGINTSAIGLFDLRHKLSIIPQDSQILEGTVRQNLDPMDEYTDEQLWNSLRLAKLEESINAMSDDEELKGLNLKLTEGGSNLSVGQRQLICLARALLNPSKILVLDEATAAVDVQTDKILQETIRSEFKDKTILTIAHRLDTVMDSDRIIVLDKGRVKEFDSPENLLKDKTSIFYSLCESGGYLKNTESSSDHPESPADGPK